MADRDYIFLIPFLIFLAILIAGFYFQLPWVIGLSIPFLILIIAAKIF